MEKHQFDGSDVTKVVKVEGKQESAECEDGEKCPLFDYSKAPEPFPVRMIPHGMYTSSESDSDTESEAFADQVQKVTSPKQMEHSPKESEEDTSDFDFTDLTYDEYLEKINKKDAPFDYSKAPEPFPVRMIPHGIYTSSESDSDTELEASEDQVKKVNSPKHMGHPLKESEEDTSDFDFTDLTSDEYLEKSNNKDTPFDYFKAPEPFPVRMIPHGMYTSSESDSDTESEAFADQVQKLTSPKQMEHPPKESEEDTSDFDFTDLTYDEYLEKTNKKDAPGDYSKAPEPFPVCMIPHGMYTSSESDSNSDSDTDSESEDKSKLKFQSSALSEDDKAPTSSILVKHGMKRPAKAGDGDKDSKRAREMASQTSDGENKGSESRVLL